MRFPLLVLCFLLAMTSVVDTGFGVIPPDPPKPEPKPAYYEARVVVTAYTDSVEECGKDDGITASGELVHDGVIAMDDLPFGTKVEIDGKMYTVKDRFGGNYKNRIDIWMPSRSSAFRFGRQIKTVKVYREEENKSEPGLSNISDVSQDAN